MRFFGRIRSLFLITALVFPAAAAHAGSFNTKGLLKRNRYAGMRSMMYDGSWAPSGSYGRGTGVSSRRLDLLSISAAPTAFERSFVVRIARVFIDQVPVASIGDLRISLKIILE